MSITRRDFLKKSAATVAVSAFTISTLKFNEAFSAESETASTKSIQKTINISDYPALQSVGGYAMISGTVIVIRTGKTKFISLNTTCTHKKCDVEFNGKKFECPCHGSEFTKFGKVLNGPAKKNLKTYSTTFNTDTGAITINM